jgi:hypothetical protein
MANLQDVEELHEVFETCGILDHATRAQMMIACEGFINLALLGKFESDNDIAEMANRTQADGRVHLETGVIIKQLQTLIWLVRDQQKRQLALRADDFDADTLPEAAVTKNLRKERADKEPSVTVLGKFG